MDPNQKLEIGTRHIWGGESAVGLSRIDRRQHLYVVGKTGTGKSTLLRNLILQNIANDEGVALIDPHGDLSREILEFIPPRRIEDVIFFNPADQDYPIALNLLQHVEPQSRHLVASSIVGSFRSVFKDSWGPRLNYLFLACASALLECQNTSLLGIPRMLTDAAYRDWVVKRVRNPAVKAFWLNEFAGWDKRFAAEIVSPLQNKVGALLLASPARLVLGQVTSKFTPRFTMDRRRILIANLSKGLLGEDLANLLGAMPVSQFQTAAMERANINEERRMDFSLYVDEFHNFATDSFANILSEMRKYRLNLVLSHQYLDQVRPEIRHAIFGNVGSMVAFRVGESDAAAISREFGSGYDPALFSGLGNGEVCIKLLDQGNHGNPFLARTHPPIGKRYGKGDTIIRRSREKFATPRAVVEDKIQRWMSRRF